MGKVEKLDCEDIISNVEAERYVQQRVGYDTESRPIKLDKNGQIKKILATEVHVNKEENTVILETPGAYKNITGPIPDGTWDDNFIRQICESKEISYERIADLKNEYIPVTGLNGSIKPDNRTLNKNISNRNSDSDKYNKTLKRFWYIATFAPILWFPSLTLLSFGHPTPEGFYMAMGFFNFLAFLNMLFQLLIKQTNPKL